MMRRSVEEKLLSWKESERRKPLILLGIRQCGKTFILTEFGKNNFKDYVRFDFERNPQLTDVFRDLDPIRIMKELSAFRGKKITKDTLVIFDEIQHCYPALTSLKYLGEELPGYHIVCAGSLLGLALAERERKDSPGWKTSFPVGKVNFIRMWPMDFGEFVLATKGEDYFGTLDDVEADVPLPEWMMSELNELYIDYLIVGGMPEAVQTWVDTQDMDEVRKVQRDIVRSFKEDMGKYSGENYQRISALWDSAAYQVAEAGNRFNLKKAGGTNKTLSDPIQWLLDADFLRRTWEVNDDSVPPNPRGGIYYKLYLPDTGLLTCMAGIDRPILVSKDESTSKIRGAVAENYILTQMSSALDIEGDTYFWTNSKGDAEVDFELLRGMTLVPVEVKSGEVGRLKSLETYCGRYSPKEVLVFSNRNTRINKGGYTFIPLYMAWKLEMYLENLGL
ncbi:MAG: ATP-binding protein [Thermoplasmata archaeon]|nr:ATP-binding protein [Thermoplasmata archaeon]